MKPDDEMLTRWVEDELDGPAAAAVDRWAASQPEWRARREQARQMKPLLRAALPAVEDPPYAEFFNARISREIAREAAGIVPAAAEVPPAARAARWRWFLPTTAVAGMVLGFWAGTWVTPESTATVVAPPTASGIPMPTVYTPEQGVKANYSSSSPADATVIVLTGVAAIPDSFELPETASIPENRPTTAAIFLSSP